MGTLSDHPLLATFAGLTDAADRDAFYLQIESQRNEFDALLLAMTSTVEQTGAYTDDGHRTAACWVTAVTNCSPHAGRQRVRTARMVRDLPLVGDAVFDGHIGPSQLEMFTRLHRNPRAATSLPAAAELLIEHAAQLPFDDFVVVAQRFRGWADPDGELADHVAARANRKMSLIADGVGFRLAASGDALTGAMIEDALRPFIDAEFDLDWTEGRAVHGDAMCPALMARTAAQRRYDALAKLIAAGSSGTGVPTVNITMDEKTATELLARQLEQPGNPFGDGVDGDDWLSLRCETTSGSPVSHNDAFIALMIGNVRLVIRDRKGRVIHLGRKRRLFTGAAREAALLTRDRCIAPGCNLRAGRIHIDHTIAWASRARGQTNPDNADPECGPHNLAKERLGQSVEPHPRLPNAWITRRRNGTIIGPRTSPEHPHAPRTVTTEATATEAVAADDDAPEPGTTGSP